MAKKTNDSKKLTTKKKETFLNVFVIQNKRNKKGGDVGNPQEPQSLLEKSRVTVDFVQQP
jgi:hypothetical protein